MDVTLKMIDGDQRLAQGEGQRLGVGHTDQQCSRQAGAFGDRDGIEIGEADAGFGQRGADDGNDVAQMLAGGEFRNHAAVRSVD